MTADPGSSFPLPIFEADEPLRGRTVYLETFGCQMNELDSELVRGHLSALGYQFTHDVNQANVVLYNTCSVRAQAENKAYSRVGIIGRRKQQGESIILGVIGCMAERDGVDMIRRFPQIDLLCGPGELDRLPLLIDNAAKAAAVDVADRVALQGARNRRTTTLSAASDNLELLDLTRAFDPDRADAGGRSAYVRITRGCNKFCTYCVVPYTRGAEVHRPPDAIVEECRQLADQGVIEVTLLGQTVNHYLYVHGAAVVAGAEAPQIGPGLAAHGQSKPALEKAYGRRVTTFADLLHRIHEEVPAIRRLRFVTSYPRDVSDDVLDVIASSPRICRYLHVPAQSGSNRILGLMNRGYTVEEYVEFIDRVRSRLPDICLGGDIIVGFPSETEEDFEATKALLRRVRFKNQFIFKYSPRPGTVALTRFSDNVSEEMKKRRNNELLALTSEISAEAHAEWVGRTVEVFVEKMSGKSSAGGGGGGGGVELRWERPGVQMSGRTMGDLITVFDVPAGASPENLIGKIVSVRVTGSGPVLLRGELVKMEKSSEMAGCLECGGGIGGSV
jgi:tRNA-2-methylthio-N6-dimethylallyladenosine synthase